MWSSRPKCLGNEPLAMLLAKSVREAPGDFSFWKFQLLETSAFLYLLLQLFFSHSPALLVVKFSTTYPKLATTDKTRELLHARMQPAVANCWLRIAQKVPNMPNGRLICIRTDRDAPEIRSELEYFSQQEREANLLRSMASSLQILEDIWRRSGAFGIY